MAFITLMVVRVSCQIWQNAAVEAAVAVDVAVGAGLLAAAGLPLGAGLPLAAGLPLEAWLPQADSARARAAVSNGVASNESRPVVRDVRFMPVVDGGNASD
jgi:hypothetical protein